MASRRPPLQVTRTAATALLVVAAVLYAVARTFEDAHWAVGYVRAFAEAALVGGLADWFAVTALFRHPFGVPIPHTAVIPRSQGRIADALGAFIVDNFLDPDLVRARLAEQDLAANAGRWLQTPANAARVADGLAAAIPSLTDMADDTRLSHALRGAIGDRLARARFAPVIGAVLLVLTRQGRHHGVIDYVIEEAFRTLEANEPALRENVKRNTAWYWRIAGLDHRASDAMIDGLEDSLRDIAADRAHPVRQRIAAMLERFARDMQTSADLQAQTDALRADLLAEPAITAFLDELGEEAKAALREGAASAQGRAAVADGVMALGRALVEDETVRDALNERLRALGVELAARHGADAAKLVSDTIRGWDAKTVVTKLEQNVGADLQYIRINGTLIGGLVGVVLHAIAHIVWS